MQPHFIQPLLDIASGLLRECAIPDSPGLFRENTQSSPIPHAAASAAAVNLRYMLDDFGGEGVDPLTTLRALQSLQQPETGWFAQEDALSVTAACICALRCLDATPRVLPAALQAYARGDSPSAFLTDLPWAMEPERAARDASALCACLQAARMASPDWIHAFVKWIHDETDEHTGLLRKGCISPIEVDGNWTLMPYLCAAIYPLALCEVSRHPLPLPWRLVDTALEVMEFHRPLFFRRRGHRHLPWIYCLSRGIRHSSHRQEEARQALRRFIPDYLDYLREQFESGALQSLTQLQWDIAALAELQLAVPGGLQSRIPLRQVLDRHPFL